MKVPPKMQTELQDVKAEITKVETEITTLNEKIDKIKQKRDNAETCLSKSWFLGLMYNSLLNSATAELARLGAQLTHLSQEKSDLRQKEKTLLEVFL